MRSFFYLLVVINLAVFAWYGVWQEGLFGQFGASVAKSPSAQAVHASKVKSPQGLAGACYELGPFPEDEGHEEIDAFLASLAIGADARSEEVEVISNYWVFVPALASADEANKLLAEIRGAGVQDSYVIEAGAHKNSVSLGLFREVDAARAREKQLRELGFDVQMQPRKQSAKMVYLRLSREAGEAFSRVSEQFSQRFPDDKYRAVACE